MANFNIPVTDYGGESSSISVPVDDAAADLDLTSLFNALDGVSIGNFGQSSLNLATPKDNGGGGASVDPFATRKLKWLARYTDNVTAEKLRLEIPCPDMALLTGNTDFADIAAGNGNLLKTPWDILVVNRRNGNATTLQSLELRGRDLKSQS